MEANFIDVDNSNESIKKDPEPSLNILKDFHKLYEDRLALIKNSLRGDKLQMENRVLHSWVQDLVEQNNLLASAVNKLESEAVRRIHLMEHRDYLEQRKHSEIVSELQTEKALLQKQLARKDSDLRGLVEVLRRLRELDYWSLEGIHFYEVTESDIFGSSEWRKKNDRGDKTEKNSKRQRDALTDTNELKIMNDALEKENKAKDREIKKLNEDLQQLRSQVCLQSQSICVDTRDIEVSASLCCPVSQCGDVEPVRDYSALWKEESDKYEAKMKQLEDSLKTNVESQRLLRESNVQLLEEVTTLRRVCCTLNEQCRAQSTRAQFKDDIIKEMRRQLKQAKTKLKEEAAALAALSSIRTTHRTSADLNSTCEVRSHSDRRDAKLPELYKLDRGDVTRSPYNKKSRMTSGDGDTMSTKSSK